MAEHIILEHFSQMESLGAMPARKCMFRGDFRGKYTTKVKHVFKNLFLDTTAEALHSHSERLRNTTL